MLGNKISIDIIVFFEVSVLRFFFIFILTFDTKGGHPDFDRQWEEVNSDVLGVGEKKKRKVDETDTAGYQEKPEPEPEKDENLLDDVVGGQDTKIVSKKGKMYYYWTQHQNFKQLTLGSFSLLIHSIQIGTLSSWEKFSAEEFIGWNIKLFIKRAGL